MTEFVYAGLKVVNDETIITENVSVRNLLRVCRRYEKFLLVIWL